MFPLAAAFALAMAVHASSAAAATTVRYQTGFEPGEGFTLGNLVGQHNWDQADGALPNVDSTVQNTLVRPTTGGLQAVQIHANGPADNPNADFTDVWTPATTVGAAAIAAEPLVTIKWDMQRGVLAGGQTETALWGIDIYDLGDATIAASIGAYDDSVGPAVAGTNSSGNFVFLGDGTPRGNWDTYTVTVNYLTRQYTVAMNGVTLGTPQSIFLGSNAGIGDVDFLALTRGTDSAYFDNFSITTSTVPEPTAALGFSAVVIGLVRKRR